jgi:cell division transport system ATP-binding protein
LVDEPTENVDAATAIEMLNLFKAFNQIGMTIVIATHHRNLMHDAHTRCLHIKNACVETGEKHEQETIVT